MSRIIKITPEVLEEVQNEFIESLSKLKMSDGKISYTRTFGVVPDKAVLYFTEKAWLKMQSLVREFDCEVSWNGLVHRVEDEENAYQVTDIVVPPQEVTGTTVTTDQEEFQNWLYEFDDDTFNALKLQGHSHVNMGVTPSGVDTTLYEGILEQLNDDMFYVFVIWNKKNDRTIKIYDMSKNVLFETADVTVKVLEGDLGLQKFIDDSKEKVVKKTYQSPAYQGYTYQGYSKSAYQTPAAAKKEEPKADDKKDKKSKKLKKKEKQTTAATYSGYANGYPYWDDDDSYSDYWRRGY